jgi:hypothetical protein
MYIGQKYIGEHELSTVPPILKKKKKRWKRREAGDKIIILNPIGTYRESEPWHSVTGFI